jgi:hypothetical protein
MLARLAPHQSSPGHYIGNSSILDPSSQITKLTDGATHPRNIPFKYNKPKDGGNISHVYGPNLSLVLAISTEEILAFKTHLVK